MMDSAVDWARRGREYWLERRLDEYDIVLLLPHADAELNGFMLRALRARLGRGGLRAVVLAVAAVEESPLYETEPISDDISQCILTLYSMYAFTSRLIVGSFTQPSGRKLKNLLDSGVATALELADTVVFAGRGI
jgi:hypothetical protein